MGTVGRRAAAWPLAVTSGTAAVVTSRTFLGTAECPLLGGGRQPLPVEDLWAELLEVWGFFNCLFGNDFELQKNSKNTNKIENIHMLFNLTLAGG